MARGTVGRQVARAASSGGGKSVRQHTPRGFQVTIVVIIVLGTLLVGYSRYEYKHGKGGTTVHPTTSDTWFTALSVNICGTVQPNLPNNVNAAKRGISTQGDGLIKIHPRGQGESGDNATLGKFVSEYPGMILTGSSLRYPGQPTKVNGGKCGSKPGQVQVKVWTNPNATTKGQIFKGDASSLKLANDMEITIAFVPKGAQIARPPATVAEALLNAISAAAKSSAPATSPPVSTPVNPTGSSVVVPPISQTTSAPPTTAHP